MAIRQAPPKPFRPFRLPGQPQRGLAQPGGVARQGEVEGQQLLGRRRREARRRAELQPCLKTELERRRQKVLRARPVVKSEV